MRPPNFVRADAVWSGQVEITRDVTIMGAEVRVQAGTTIRFTGGRGAKGPVIRLSSPLFVSGDPSRPARLVFDGAPDRPIIVESTEGPTSGAIFAGPSTTTALDARHVIFRRLGPRTSEHIVEPAIAVQLAASDNDLLLTHCRFEDCGPVRADFIGPDASGEIARCSFSDTRGPVAVRFAGPGTGVKVIRENIGDAGIEVACSQTLIGDNVLIGKTAAVMVRRSAVQGVSVVGNYIHCTATKDIGRYAVKCENPATRLVENVLVGGSYVIETAPRAVERNVVIGTGDLEAELPVAGGAADLLAIRSMTHALVTNLCPECVISGNLLLGPVYASISMGRAVGFRVAGNVLDGWGAARHALQLDVAAIGQARVAFVENIVADYTQVPIVAEARQNSIELKADKNTFVGITGPAYEGFVGLADLAPGDRRADTMASLNLSQAGRGAPATQAAADVDDLLRTRRKTPAAVHRMWFDAYGSTNRQAPLPE